MPDAPEIAEHKSSKFTLRDMKKREQSVVELKRVLKLLGPA